MTPQQKLDAAQVRAGMALAFLVSAALVGLGWITGWGLAAFGVVGAVWAGWTAVSAYNAGARYTTVPALTPPTRPAMSGPTKALLAEDNERLRRQVQTQGVELSTLRNTRRNEAASGAEVVALDKCVEALKVLKVADPILQGRPPKPDSVAVARILRYLADRFDVQRLEGTP